MTGEGDVREVSDAHYRRIVGANVDGVVFGVRRLARVMAEGGAIVVTASLAGLTTMATDPIYAGTKHFVVGFVRSVAPAAGRARDHDQRGLPWRRRHAAARSAARQGARAGIELLRPEEIADAVLLAARDGSTGQAWTCLPGRAPEKHEFHRFFDSA